MKRLVVYALALVVLGALVGWVSVSGGLPEPTGAVVGQFISRKVHFAFLFLSLVALALGPLHAGEGRLMRVLWTAGAVAIHFVVVQLGKKLYFWPRPIDVGHTVDDAVRGSGFPSGHTVPVFIVAVMVGTLYPRFQIPALLTAILIGYSRAEVLAHFPIQVWLSALIGIALGVFWTTVREAVLKQRPASNSEHPIALP